MGTSTPRASCTRTQSKTSLPPAPSRKAACRPSSPSTVSSVPHPPQSGDGHLHEWVGGQTGQVPDVHRLRLRRDPHLRDRRDQRRRQPGSSLKSLQPDGCSRARPTSHAITGRGRCSGLPTSARAPNQVGEPMKEEGPGSFLVALGDKLLFSTAKVGEDSLGMPS